MPWQHNLENYNNANAGTSWSSQWPQISTKPNTNQQQPSVCFIHYGDTINPITNTFAVCLCIAMWELTHPNRWTTQGMTGYAERGGQGALPSWLVTGRWQCLAHLPRSASWGFHFEVVQVGQVQSVCVGMGVTVCLLVCANVLVLIAWVWGTWYCTTWLIFIFITLRRWHFSAMTKARYSSLWMIEHFWEFKLD